MSEFLTDQQEELIRDTVCRIGEDAWGSFQPESQVGISTAKLCFATFENLNQAFDYTSIITPIMKALEIELKKRFYVDYLHYLRRKYAAADYADVIGGDVDYRMDKILRRNAKGIFFRFDTGQFTLGDFRYTIGASSLTRINIYKPVIAYCQEVIFEGAVDESAINKWLIELVLSIEPLRKLRNESAHGGKIQELIEAQTVLDALIDVEKLLVKVVRPEL